MLDTLRFFFTGMISANNTVQHGVFIPFTLENKSSRNASIFPTRLRYHIIESHKIQTKSQHNTTQQKKRKETPIANGDYFDDGGVTGSFRRCS
jgi:hypothetical protein